MSSAVRALESATDWLLYALLWVAIGWVFSVLWSVMGIWNHEEVP